MVEIECGVLHESGIVFFHANGRASATNIASEREQFVHVYHIAAFVASGFGSFFEIEFVATRDDADKDSDFVAS